MVLICKDSIPCRSVASGGLFLILYPSSGASEAIGTQPSGRSVLMVGGLVLTVLMFAWNEWSPGVLFSEIQVRIFCPAEGAVFLPGLLVKLTVRSAV